MCCSKNKKFILFKECLLKYWDISGNILLYQTLTLEQKDENKYPTWVYILASIAIITSFARLMLKFRRLNIPSISCIMYPMLPCENCMCDTRQNGTYQPVWKRIFCGGFILFILWLWYAILIYPFITFFVIISVFYYDIDQSEFIQLLHLYKNHNIIALFIEDLPIMICLITIYSIDKKGLFTLIWICILTFIKILSMSRRLYLKKKLLYSLEELQEEIVEYELANTNSDTFDEPLETSLNLETQILQEDL